MRFQDDGVAGKQVESLSKPLDWDELRKEAQNSATANRKRKLQADHEDGESSDEDTPRVAKAKAAKAPKAKGKKVKPAVFDDDSGMRDEVTEMVLSDSEDEAKPAVKRQRVDKSSVPKAASQTKAAETKSTKKSPQPKKNSTKPKKN